jgi:DNA-binding NarL/FixJ family response regulator
VSDVAPSRPLRVVIADDHPAIVSAIRAFLETEPEIDLVGTAAQGSEARRLIVERKPDIALLDVRMPEPGGIEIARQLVSDGAPTGVILFTGYADRAVLLEALDAGARGFLLKEAPREDLARAARIVAGGGTYVDPQLSSMLVGAEATERLTSLSKREREILRLLANGKRNDAIALDLGISPFTVRTHIRHAMEKLEADTRTEAVATALRQSLID